MNTEEENTKEEENLEQSREDEIMKRILKYTQGCGLVFMVIVTIIVLLLFLFVA